jgi:hypothetical protein
VGEARKRRETQEALLQRYPFCIYCGGQNPATSIEHMPPIMMFKGKQRPEGLVFPACDECNQGTSHSDLVASMIGRMYPDAGDPVEKADIQKTISAVANNVPGVPYGAAGLPKKCKSPLDYLSLVGKPVIVLLLNP